MEKIIKKNVFDIIIIGAGIAGLSSVKAIYETERDVSVCLINGEDREPYKRTKISKFLYSGFSKNQFSILDKSWSQNSNLTLIHGIVTNINSEDKKVILQDGSEYTFNACIIAVGVEAARYEGTAAGSNKIFYLRRADQAEKLHQALRGSKNPVVIGGGVLGVEVSEQIRLMEKEVQLLSRSKQLMPNRLTGYAANHLQQLLEDNNISVRTSISIEAIHETDGNLRIETDRGNITSDCVVICIGSQPVRSLVVNDSLIEDIKTFDTLSTEYNGIFTAGDCTTSFINDSTEQLWHAAETEGYHAGKNALGHIHNKPLTGYTGKPYRMKCEVFDTFYFSMNYDITNRDLSIEETYAPAYRFFQYKQHQLTGIVLIGDKERQKEYQKALWEGWSENQVHHTFD